MRIMDLAAGGHPSGVGFQPGTLSAQLGMFSGWAKFVATSRNKLNQRKKVCGGWKWFRPHGA